MRVLLVYQINVYIYRTQGMVEYLIEIRFLANYKEYLRITLRNILYLKIVTRDFLLQPL